MRKKRLKQHDVLKSDAEDFKPRNKLPILKKRTAKSDTNKLFADIKLFAHVSPYTHVCKQELCSNSEVKKMQLCKYIC